MRKPPNQSPINHLKALWRGAPPDGALLGRDASKEPTGMYSRRPRRVVPRAAAPLVIEQHISL
ncbi:MAG: hypothetical protein O2868_16460, partial [Proteobacteria bacterium]|nr:hypothetical protein [Pseudomonadota bacterium]